MMCWIQGSAIYHVCVHGYAFKACSTLHTFLPGCMMHTSGSGALPANTRRTCDKVKESGKGMLIFEVQMKLVDEICQIYSFIKNC